MEIKDVENLAELARLELSMEEKESLLKDMVGIIDYVKQIEAVQLDAVNPVYKLQNAWREDLPRQADEIREFSHDLVVGQFPESKDGFLKVKKIL